MSVRKGGFAPLGEYKKTWIFDKIENLISNEGYSLSSPLGEIDADLIQLLLYGNDDMELEREGQTEKFEGIINFITRHADDSSAAIQRWAQGFMNKKTCDSCQGTRLRKEALHFKIGELHIGDVAQMDLSVLWNWLMEIEGKLSKDQLSIAFEIIKELKARLGFILDVGLSYLTLNRSSKTLSGGEAQRIRLATQIGTELINVFNQ